MRLVGRFGEEGAGRMRVQMTSDTQIRWEVFGDNATPGAPTAFTSAVRTYTR